MEIIITIVFYLIIRSPIIYLKARLWEWLWKKICKKEKFESIYACLLSLPPILICFINMAVKQIHTLNTFMIYNIISNGVLSLVIYSFLQKEREKKIKINVAGRLNTPEYKYYSQILEVPPGKINTDRLIKTYMEKRRRAENKEDREQIELAYLYFTNYKEYKRITEEVEEAKGQSKENAMPGVMPEKSENVEMEESFRRRLSGRY